MLYHKQHCLISVYVKQSSCFLFQVYIGYSSGVLKALETGWDIIRFYRIDRVASVFILVRVTRIIGCF